MLTAIAISNYRSLRNLVIPLTNLNVVTGPNGSGKSNHNHRPQIPIEGSRAIAKAAERTQVIVVTHAKTIVLALEEQAVCNSVILEKKFGETKVVGSGIAGSPSWHWPSR